MRRLGEHALLALLLTRALNGSTTTAVAGTRTAEDSPSVAIGAPTSAAWREEVLARAKELSGLADWLEHRTGGLTDAEGRLLSAARAQIRAARETASGEDGVSWWRMLRRFRRFWGGASVERTTTNLDSAETDLLRIAGDDYVRGQLPGLQAQVNRYLRPDDPRRLRVTDIARAERAHPPQGVDMDIGAVVGAHHAANTQRRRDIMRVRSFRNILIVGTVILTLIAAGVAALGFVAYKHVPLCFLPVVEARASASQQVVVCPTQEFRLSDPANSDAAIDAAANPWDILLIESIGLVAAAVAGAVAVRGLRGTSLPYSLPVAVAVLKLPLGALTAVLGLILMSGGFVPGLSALDSSSQILAWAVLFGYAQQLFTRIVDRQANSVLEDAGGRDDERSKTAV